jgi:hypothetical protein
VTLTDIIARAVNIVANIAPWLAPLPTAWLVADRTMLHLHFPPVVAWIAGAMLELLGVAIMATCLDLWSYERTKRKADPGAPLALAVGLVALYLVAALLLVLVLDLLDGVATWSQAIFPILSVASFAVLGLRYDHRERLVSVAQNKAEQKANRAERRANRAELEPDPTEPEPNREFGTKSEHVRYLLETEPDISRLALMAKTGASASYVSELIAEHKAKGEAEWTN